MRPPLYRRTVQLDLDHWIKDGLVPQASRDAILADLNNQKHSLSAVGILAMLGAIFMALAGLSFVAANWGVIPKLVRLGFILAMMWSAFGISIYALNRNAAAFAHAFALIGAALFGGGIMLVAQIFNISAHYPNGILIWAIGALAVALSLRSRPVLLLSAILVALWMLISYWGPLPGNPFILYYPVIAGTFFVLALRFHAPDSQHVLILATLVWIINVLSVQVEHEHLHGIEAGSLYAAIMLSLVLVCGFFKSSPNRGIGILQFWSSIALLIASFAIQFSFTDQLSRTNEVPTSMWYLLAGATSVLVLFGLGVLWLRKRIDLITGIIIIAFLFLVLLVPWLDDMMRAGGAHLLYGAAFFAGAVAAMMQGAKTHNRTLIWLGGLAFTAEALYAYFETFKNLLSTSIFFFIGGLLLLGFALFAMRFGKRVRKEGQT